MEHFLSLILQFAFWISLAAIFHTYALYPLLISKLKTRNSSRPLFKDDEQWPDAHVVMAMYNEEAVIRNTLKSIVKSNYPGKLTIHIGSDNSSDSSHDIVDELSDQYPNIQLTVFSGRNGKIQIMNSLVEEIPEDGNSVLLLCDANVTWSASAARNLVRHFKDEEIGIVACNVLDKQSSSKGIAKQEEAYVNRENVIKYNEGELWGRMMGAFGACYAMRRSCYAPVPSTYNVDDFFETIACYEAGYRGIVDLDAVCYEAVSQDISEEFRRKKRISKGNFQNLKHFFNYLMPWGGGLPTSFAFWSHKGLRWFGPIFLILMMASAAALACMGAWLYVLAVVGISFSILAAGVDRLMEVGKIGFRISLFRFVRYFYTMNVALLLGGFEFCRGVSNSVWEPTKRLADSDAQTETPN